MSAADPEAALAITGLHKHFGGTAAVAGVDLRVRPGTVHALLGGNGSGKSTTIKVLAGVYRADAGTIRVGERSWDAGQYTAAEGYAAGLRFVHQDLGVFDDLTVAENIALASGWPVQGGVRVRWSALHRRVAALIERFEIDADPWTPLGGLRPAGRTMVAIARALQDRESADLVLVLDEPTASLPEQEAAHLLEQVRKRADLGQTVVLVSHRLQEVIAVADDYTVLRDGEVAGTIVAERPTEAQVVNLIAGRAVSLLAQDGERAADRERRPARLQVRGLSAGPLTGVDLTVDEGEIVGVAGLLGSGRTTLLRTLFGEVRPTAGHIELDGRPADLAHPAAAMRAGIAYVPEDRKGDGAFMDLSVRANLSATVVGEYFRRGRLDQRAERRDTDVLIRQYGIRAPGAEAPLATLSGGNQQKVMLARWLRRTPRLLLLDEPTQGVDVMSRADIYAMIREAAGHGCATLVVSSDVEELIALCQRIAVLSAGRVVTEVGTADISADHLVHLVHLVHSAPQAAS